MRAITINWAILGAMYFPVYYFDKLFRRTTTESVAEIASVDWDDAGEYKISTEIRSMSGYLQLTTEDTITFFVFEFAGLSGANIIFARNYQIYSIY